jgi:hypothetical protein
MGAERHVDDPRRQPVDGGEGADEARPRIELIDSPAVTEVEETPAVLRHAQDAVARQALRAGVGDRPRPGRAEVLHPDHAAVGGGDPETPAAVDEQIVDRSRAGREEIGRTVGVPGRATAETHPRQPAAGKTDPEIAGGILGERRGRAAAQALDRGHRSEASRAPVPLRKKRFGSGARPRIAERGHPEAAARVLEQAGDLPHLAGSLHERDGSPPQTGGIAHFGETPEPRRTAQPDLAARVRHQDLVAPPPQRASALDRLRRHVLQLLAVEMKQF